MSLKIGFSSKQEKIYVDNERKGDLLCQKEVSQCRWRVEVGRGQERVKRLVREVVRQRGYCGDFVLQCHCCPQPLYVVLGNDKHSTM